jgi:hypothetical protein
VRFAFRELELLRKGFGHGVGGHDRLGGRQPVALRQQRLGQRGDDAPGWQWLHDHPGGEGQHLVGVAAQMRSERLADLGRALQAVLAGAGVGVTRIDHQGLHVVLQVLLRQDHRRRAKAVLREHAGHRGARRKAQHQKVLAARLLHARHRDAKLDAGYGMEECGIGREEIDRHGLFTSLWTCSP